MNVNVLLMYNCIIVALLAQNRQNLSKIIVLSLYDSQLIVVYAESSKIAIKTLKIAPKSLKSG